MSFLRSKIFSHRPGFTLFELMVSITIIGLLVGVVVSRMSDYFEVDVKRTANQLASTIRYLSNKAVTEGVYLRLVLDISERSYWIEATRDPFLMSDPNASLGKSEGKEEEKGKKEEKEREEGEEKPSEEVEVNETTAPGLPKLELKEPEFSPVESYLLRPTRIPESVFIKDFMSEEHPAPIEEGKVSIYFFPDGYVERVIINLRDEDDEVNYSLETNPVSGNVSVKNEYRMFEK